MQNSLICPLKLNKLLKIDHYFVMKMNKMMSSILAFIRPIENHTMIKSPINILIPELCRTKMTILMMILKTSRQKRIILIHCEKKFHEEHSHEHTNYVDNDKQSKYCTDDERMSHEQRDHNNNTEDKDKEDNKSVFLSKIMNTYKKQYNADTEIKLGYREDFKK